MRIWTWDLQEQIQLQLVAKVIKTLQTLLQYCILAWTAFPWSCTCDPLLQPLSKLLAIQEHVQNLEEQLWMEGRREVSKLYLTDLWPAVIWSNIFATGVSGLGGTWTRGLRKSTAQPCMLPLQYVSYCAVFAKDAWCCTFLLLDFCRFFWNLRTSSVTKWGSSIFRKRGVTDSWGWCCCFSGR